jgi:hypothetical protein
MKAYLKDQCGWFKKQEKMDPFVQQYYNNKQKPNGSNKTD